MKKQALKCEIDQLVYVAVFGSNNEKRQARFKIWNQAIEHKIIPASINNFYLAQGSGKISQNITTPAMNIRGMTYDTARAAFTTAKKNKVGAFVFEIARSEMGYTNQTPNEYVIVIMAAALKEGWSGPLFIQGDHFQAKISAPGKPKAGEIQKIKKLIARVIEAGFYNIDIDMSTLVDLSQKTAAKQQKPNIKYSLEIAKLVRSLEPSGVTISLGGEIGHIGGKNSTVADFNAYMQGFNAGLGKNMIGVNKISIQTGTHHGGVVMADGSLADVDVDFKILQKITLEGRKKYGIGGSVQHGASTLPDKFFSQFPKAKTLEIHLATGLQNIQLDHPAFPKKLLNRMYVWLDKTKINEKGIDQTSAQFHYQLRKKTWGQFKRETWDISESAKTKIRATLSKRFEFWFHQLNVINTKNLVSKFVQPIIPQKNLADFAVKKNKR